MALLIWVSLMLSETTRLCMKNILLFFILNLFVGFSTYAQSCGFSFSSSNFVAEIDNNVQSIAHSLRVRRSSSSNNCRNVRAYFTRGRANSYSRHAERGNLTVPYNLYKESALNNVLKDYGDANGNEYLTFSLADRNTTYGFDFFVKVIDLDSVFSNGPGYYNDLIEVKLYSERSNGGL